MTTPCTQVAVRFIRTNAFLWFLALLPLIFTACNRSRDQAASSGDRAVKGDDAVISALVRAEETCLTLSPKMSALSKGMGTLQLPGPGAETVFASSVDVADV